MSFDSEALADLRAESETMLPRGTTILYIVSNIAALEARYKHCLSLAWRDAGALAGLLQLCATAMGLGSCILGFHGVRILDVMRMERDKWLAVGAIAIGNKPKESAL
ncbi:MAG: nitroreductase family protein [Vulcanimicrobiaceae bacterium]